jgi:hypothetical protein
VKHANWLACGLALALLALPAAGQDEGRTLVVVTWERRVGSPFGAHPEAYGDSLAVWRGQVLDLLFADGAAGPGTGPLVLPGDAVALFADGATEEFPGRAPLTRESSGERVGQVLRQMLTLPGAPGEPAPAFRLLHASGAGDRERVDAEIRAAITCRLASAPPDCATERGGGGPGTEARAFSRPLLTFPEQYAAASAAFARDRGELPASVYWIWVQVGGRVNEVNSLAAEIVRDFGDSPAGRAVEGHHARAARSMTFRLLGRGGRPGAEGGVALWKVTSASLERMMNPPASLPLALQARSDSTWRAVDPRYDPRPGFFESTSGLLPSGSLRVVLAPPRPVAQGDLLRLQARLLCTRPGESPDTMVLAPDAWVLRGETASLDARAADQVHAHAARCLPSQAFGAKLRRQAFRRRVPVDWKMEVAALVGPRPDTAALAAPPVLTVLELRRSWAQSLLGLTEYLILAACAVAALGVLGWWGWHFLSPTVLAPVLLGADGAPFAPGAPLPLATGGGAPTAVRLALQRRSGRRRGGRVTVPVWGTGLQAEVPLRPDAEAARVVEVRTPTAGAAGRQASPLRVQVPVQRGAGAAPLALYAPDSVVDVDRAPVGVPLRAGIEVEVGGVAAGGIRVLPGSFYLPCTLRLGHVPVRRPPRVLVRLDQGYLYRGLRIDPREWSADVPLELGTLRLLHPAEPGVTARPYPVRLELKARARAGALAGGRDVAVPVRAAIRHAGQAAAELSLLLDRAELDLPLEVFPAELLDVAARTGRLEVEVRGFWSEVRENVELEARPLESARESVRVYPGEQIHGVAVDFGTSATRMAFLGDMEGPERVAAVCIPDPLIPADPDSNPEEWPGELDSEVGVDAEGHVVKAGDRGRLATDGHGFDSLKQALMDNPGDQAAWIAAGEVIGRLGELVEREGGNVRLARWVDGIWRPYSRPLPAPLRYLLLVTVPDSFTHAEQSALMERFAGWRSAVEVFPLREAEAVVYGFLRRGKGSRPARTLVVDVGAGTVDYAAVRCTFAGDTLAEIAVEGLAVSRAAGNRFDEAVGAFLGVVGGGARKLRGIKETRFTDPEALHADPDPEVARFLADDTAREYFRAAIDTPLDALLGRLSLQPAWAPPGFDQVVLSGRGSLGAGWKQHLAEALTTRGLVPAGAERAWLHWLGAGEGRGANRVRAQAERLKGAVAEGALALLAFEQTRIQTSRDILRDHLILITQNTEGFRARLLLRAGEPVPEAGVPAEPVNWEGWARAWLVYSSHPPLNAVPGVPGYDAERLWRAIGGKGAASEGQGVPEVRQAAPPPRPRPGEERGAVLRVRVERGGVVRWTFQPQPERSLTA